MPRVDFSDNAAICDRRHGTFLSESEAHQLWLAARLEPDARILDIGAGTGRVAVPLAGCGGQVIALEPAPGMVKELRAKIGQARVRTVTGAGDDLAFRSESFQAVVVARLLYLTPRWQQVLAEAHRVLAATEELELHEWGNGHSDEPWVRVREEARRLFEEAGVATPFHPRRSIRGGSPHASGPPRIRSRHRRDNGARTGHHLGRVPAPHCRRRGVLPLGSA